MKLLTVLLSSSIALAWCTEAIAADQTKRYPRANSKVVKQSPTRSTTTDANGLCIRDTGKPLSELNFRDRCDYEEFWVRQEQRGGTSRP